MRRAGRESDKDGLGRRSESENICSTGRRAKRYGVGSFIKLNRLRPALTEPSQ